MQLLHKFKNIFPYLLPALLLFSRSLADLSVILLSILFLLKCFKEKDFSWLRLSWVKATILFLIYLIFINSLFSLNRLDSLIYSLSFLRWPLFAIALAYWIFLDINSLKKFYISLLLTLTFFLINLWYQFIVDADGFFGFSSNVFEGRLSVPFSNNVIPGRLIALFSFILVILNFFFNTIRKTAILNFSIFIIIFIGFISVFITGERMVFLIYLSSIFILFIIITIDTKNYFLFFSFISFLIILLTFFYYFEPLTFQRTISSTINKIPNLFSTDYGEVFITSYKKWMNNFFIGGGLHQYKYIEPIYGFLIWKNTPIYHAHNLPLNLLVETGLIGLLLYYQIIIKIIVFTFKKIDFKKSLILITLTIILIYINFFPLHTHFKLSHNWINASAWFAVGIILSISKIYEQNNSSK